MSGRDATRPQRPGTTPPIRSFADLQPHKAAFQPPAPEWIEWDTRALKKRMLNESTITLRTWLDARLADLIRERIAFERISMSSQGGRTSIRVDNVVRFEFKLKCSMEGK